MSPAFRRAPLSIPIPTNITSIPRTSRVCERSPRKPAESISRPVRRSSIPRAKRFLFTQSCGLLSLHSRCCCMWGMFSCDACACSSRALLDNHACSAHVFERLVLIVRPHIDTAATFTYNVCRQPELTGIQCRELDAVVGGQAEDIDRVHTSLAQGFGEFGLLLMIVVKEAAVAVDERVHAFSNDGLDRAHV